MWSLAFLLFAGAVLPATPELSSSQIVSAATFQPGPVAPGELIVLFPRHAGPETLVRAELDRHGIVSTALAGTRVLFDGRPAPLAYAGHEQICVVVPYELAGRDATDVVIEYAGRRSPPVTVPVGLSAPGLFTLNSTGKGQAGMLNEMGCCNSTRNPAMRGSIVGLYATGEGQTKPAGIDGRVVPYISLATLPRPRLPVKVTLGGVPAEVIFAGAAPNMVSMMQVNIRVPANAPIGDAVPLVLTVGENSSPATATMAVRSSEQIVLIIDADRARRCHLVDLFSSAGYIVITAYTGADAVAQTRLHPVDLAVFSLDLPRQESLAAIGKMQALRPLLKIVATAARSDAASLRAADMLGAQALFSNPLTPRSIHPRVHELLRSHPVPYALMLH